MASHGSPVLPQALLSAALLAFLLPAGRGVAVEAALVVNTTDGGRDTVCDAHCSLADAINTANREPTVTSIVFAIPADDPGCDAAGVCTIQPQEPPEELITVGVTIDGFSQAGATENTAPLGEPINAVLKIVLDGTLLGSCCANGLVLRGAENRVRGLVIHRFYTGIYVRDAAGARIDGIFVGTDASGTIALGNTCSGISVSGTVGQPGSSGTIVGGAAPEHRNLVSGNGCVGIEIGPSGSSQVQGNYIGTDATGTGALPNDRDGVYIFSDSPDNLVGGEAPEAGNLIAFNHDAGVRVIGAGAVRNTISRNRLRGNLSQGIALADGGNGNLPAPLISAASPTVVHGTACAGCVIEVFSAADDEGDLYEGTVVADGSGEWRLEQPAGFSGPNLTATATDPLGNTSPFSAPASTAPTATPTPSATVPVPTPSASATSTRTQTPTASSSHTPTASASASATATRPATEPPPSASATASLSPPSATATPTLTPTAATPSISVTPGGCPGDCDGDDTVSIDELVRAVNIALGSQSIDACQPADRNGDRRVMIEELVAAVGAALAGC